MSPKRVLLIVVLVLIPPTFGLALAVYLGWIRLGFSFDTVLIVLGAYGGWVAFLAALAEIASYLRAREKSGSRPGAHYQLPRPLDEFVGRADEVRRLVRALKPGSRTAITGLVGMGGLGKTELAKFAASRVARRFRDGVLWADCGQQDQATIADLWAAAYGVRLPGDNAETKATAWRGLVSSKQVLLIFDNVQPRQEIEPLFPPTRGRSAVLITSRHADHPALRSSERLQLDQFTSAEAMALADRVLGREVARQQSADATRLFDLLGYLPMGVAVALHLARNCGWSLATLNSRLEAAGALALLGDKEALHRSLNATFKTAWDNLPADLRDTFHTLALFNEGPSFSTRALAETLALEQPEAHARLHRGDHHRLPTEHARRPVLADARTECWTSEQPG